MATAEIDFEVGEFCHLYREGWSCPIPVTVTHIDESREQPIRVRTAPPTQRWWVEEDALIPTK